MSHQPTLAITRRQMISLATALGAFALAPASSPHVDAADEAGDACLVVGHSRTGALDDLFMDMLVYDQSGNVITELEHPAGVISMEDMARPGWAAFVPINGSPVADVRSGEFSDLHWPDRTPEWMAPMPFNSDSGYLSERFLVVSSMEFDSVLLIDLKKERGEDITEFVLDSEQEFVPASATFSRSSNMAGVWSGDHVWLLDLADPESSRVLDGGVEDWYSTTMDLSDGDEWVSYTIYDPDSNGEAGIVILERADGSDRVEVAEGTAWSQITFIPGDEGRFLLFNEGRVELRTTDDPTAEGTVLFESTPDPRIDVVWNADFSSGLIGLRVPDSTDITWMLIDVKNESAKSIPGLDGSYVLHTRVPNSAVAYLLFAPLTKIDAEEDSGPIIGFSFETGETHEFFPDVHLSAEAAPRGSRDGRWYTMMVHQPKDMRGTYLLDLKNGTHHAFPYGGGTYSGPGYVSPDGSLVAISLIERPNGDITTNVAPTESPDDLEEWIEGVPLGWVS